MTLSGTLTCNQGLLYINLPAYDMQATYYKHHLLSLLYSTHPVVVEHKVDVISLLPTYMSHDETMSFDKGTVLRPDSSLRVNYRDKMFEVTPYMLVCYNDQCRNDE